jgi:hypothetical protein
MIVKVSAVVMSIPVMASGISVIVPSSVVLPSPKTARTYDKQDNG